MEPIVPAEVTAPISPVTRIELAETSKLANELPAPIEPEI